MQDIEKNRVEYVARMEETLQHLKRQLDETKPLAERWTPVVSSVNEGDNLRITLAFGGKRVTIALPTKTVVETDATTLTSTVVDTMIKNVVFDQLTPLVRPEIEKVQRAQGSIQNAGKW